MTERNRPAGLGLVFIVISFILTPGLGAQASQDKEARAEVYLTQADELYSRGEYQKAIENYNQVVSIAEKRLNLSRANMGLSLCYFFLNDTENAKKYILKTLEVNPKKEVSSLFYPQTYVDLFNQVKTDNAERLAAIAAALVEEVKAPPGRQEAGRAAPQPILEALGEERPPGGHFEFEVHYGVWSINPAKGAFEDTLTKKAANEIRDHVTDQLNDDYGGNLSPSSYSHALAMDSSGSNSWMKYLPYDLDLKKIFEKAITAGGPDKVIFGTDSTFFPRGFRINVLEQQYNAVKALSEGPSPLVSEEDVDAIFRGNILRLNGFKPTAIYRD